MEKHEFEDRKDSTLKKLTFSVHQKSIGKIKDPSYDQSYQNCYYFSKSSSLPISILVEEMMPVVREQDNFECRGKLKFISLSGVFGLSGVWCRKQVTDYSTKENSTKSKFPIEASMGEVRPEVTEPNGFE